MNKGLFNLTNLESMGDDDIISMNINESTNEFSNREPDTNHPEDHFDKDTAAGSAPNVSIPGGDKETPNAKPYDKADVSVPGGDKESPSAKPADASSVSVPSKVTLTTSEYDNALAALKKSFKEGYEIMEMLEHADVVEKTVEQKQEEYVESVLSEQLLLAYEDGPVFEAVKREDKDDVKELVRSLRPKIEDALHDAKIKFYKPNLVLRVLTGFIPSGLTQPNLVSGIHQIWVTRLWQVVGAVCTEPGNIKDVCDSLTKKYESQLGKYKILYVKAVPTVADLFRVKFNWKNDKEVFFILVDKKIPKELSEVEDMVEDAVKESDKAKEESENVKKK